MNQCIWRLHLPPPDSIGDGKKILRKAAVYLGSNVYIRPKSVKELGVSGRIVAISNDSSVMNNILPKATTHLRVHKKRKMLVEDVRVSVQQHCPPGMNSKCGPIKTGIRPSRLFPVYDIIDCNNEQKRTHSLILLTPDTTNYRQLASSHVRAYDKVLEIGCSTGECTALLLRRLILLHINTCKQDDKGAVKEGGKIIAFDTGSDMIEKAKHRVMSELNYLLPQGNSDNEKMSAVGVTLNFHKIDAITNPIGAITYATTGDDRCPDVILIDIGGNRELKAVIHMIHWVQSAFGKSPRLVIIKSRALVDELISTSSDHLDVGEGKCEWDEEAGKSENNQSILGMNPKRPVVSENGVIQHAQEWFTLHCSNISQINQPLL